MRCRNYVQLLCLFGCLWSVTVGSQESIPATDLNVVRSWYSLSNETPDYESLAGLTSLVRSANQFDRQDALKSTADGLKRAFEGEFTGGNHLTVVLSETLTDYDFDRSGFPISAFNGRMSIPIDGATISAGRGATVNVDADQNGYSNTSYVIQFSNPEEFAFMPLAQGIARELMAGRNSQRVDLVVTLQPIGADESGAGNYRSTRSLTSRVVEVQVTRGNELVWSANVAPLRADAIAAAVSAAGETVEINRENIDVIWHRLNGSSPDFYTQASKTPEFRSANRFDKASVLEDEVRKAKDYFDGLIPDAKYFGGRIRTKLSAYDANRGGFHVELFSGGAGIQGGIFFENAANFAFIASSPQEADALMDRHGRNLSAIVDFEAQPLLALSHIKNLASLDRERRIVTRLTEVKVTVDSGSTETVLLEASMEPLSASDLSRLEGQSPTIDTASQYDDADIVLTWAKAAKASPDFELWAKQSTQFKWAENEFVADSLYTQLVDERRREYFDYSLSPWRVRIAARLSDYDFANQRFELERIDFGQSLKYSDQLYEDMFAQRAPRRVYELRLVNLEDLRYLGVDEAAAQEMLALLGTARSVTLDLLVYPAKAYESAAYEDRERRVLEALVTEVRLLGNTVRFGGAGVTRLYETSVAEPPVDVIAAGDVRNHIDPYGTDIKRFTLGMTRSEFQRKAMAEFGKVEPYKGNDAVLRFENADGEVGYGHFDANETLVFMRYIRSLPGRGKTAAVAASVKKKYGEPFADERADIGSHIKTTYLYYSNPRKLGLDLSNPKVGLWVKIEESDQLRPLTQLQINMGTEP